MHIIQILNGGVLFLFIIMGLHIILARKKLPNDPSVHIVGGTALVLVGIHALFATLATGDLEYLSAVPAVIDLVALPIIMYYGLIVPAQGRARTTHKEYQAPQETAPTVMEEAKDEKESGAPGNEDSDEVQDVEKLTTENLDEMELDDNLFFFQKLECAMANQRLFCKPDITRDEAAAAIGTNRTYMARSIKAMTGLTFYEYIITQRANYAATLLTTTNETIEAIGMLSGFRSRSAFYRAFSTQHGCSPQEYRKKMTWREVTKNKPSTPK